MFVEVSKIILHGIMEVQRLHMRAIKDLLVTDSLYKSKETKINIQLSRT